MKKIIYTLMSFSPVLALAQSFTTFDNTLNFFERVIKRLVPLLFTLAIVYFFYGMIQYIKSAGKPEDAAKGKSIMIYGIVAIAVMASVYGLVAWLQNLTGVGSATGSFVPPQVQF